MVLVDTLTCSTVSQSSHSLADAWLVFEVELISIGDAPPVVNVFKQIDSDADEHLSKEEVRAGRGGAQVLCPLMALVVMAVAITAMSLSA